ncbi:peptidylprolyl isomerase [Acidicapsa dinghuensis]|uniref:Peptidylprolyl isomerase n=1 Tax=Acidicapsa dinghuensis TaxID=2218256 RepID=A0ABW1EJD2_9BACT|nr:peptidylprolyl isomerase [Acidicapsa dinghuensis]
MRSSIASHILTCGRRVLFVYAAYAAIFACAPHASAQPDAPHDDKSAQFLDSVVAVVNNQAILSSDLDLEMRIVHLLPSGTQKDYTPQAAIERLTTRVLIEQQILQEDPHGLEIPAKELDDALTELRQGLPACKIRDCNSAQGWAAYLATLGLTPQQVQDYWQHRMAVLRFIELRFRSGIRISQDDIQKYYNQTLLPQYAHPQDAPPLDRVTPRIQEILLQQQVNDLLTQWLKSLQDQGQVEILDPALRSQASTKEGGRS